MSSTLLYETWYLLDISPHWHALHGPDLVTCVTLTSLTLYHQTKVCSPVQQPHRRFNSPSKRYIHSSAQYTWPKWHVITSTRRLTSIASSQRTREWKWRWLSITTHRVAGNGLHYHQSLDTKANFPHFCFRGFKKSEYPTVWSLMAVPRPPRRLIPTLYSFGSNFQGRWQGQHNNWSY